MKIGIIGSGNMGRSIGFNLAGKGHEVFFGHRRPEAAASIKQTAQSLNLSVQTGTNEEAALHADVAVYCIRNVLPSSIMDKSQWRGKILIDINNRFNADEASQLPAHQSIAEHFQADLPETYIVKAFNNHAHETFELSYEELKNSRAGSFYCGDNTEANQTVAALMEQMGLTPVYGGKINQARILESMAHLLRTLIQERGLFISYALAALPAPQAILYGSKR